MRASPIYTIGVIGTGIGATLHVQGLKAHPSVQVVAVVGRDLRRAQETARAYDVPYAFGEVERLWDLAPDIIVVATPPLTHVSLALRALEAGAAVLCEKPMAGDANEARTMLSAATRMDRPTAINFQGRFDPERVTIHELLRQGFVGLPKVIAVRYFSAQYHGRDSRVWNWVSRAAEGGGMLQAFGVHFLDAIRWWAGEIESVTAVADTLVRERHDRDGVLRPVDAEDTFSVLLRLASGGVASLEVSPVMAHGTGLEVDIYGTDGTLHLRGDRIRGGRTGEAVAELPLTGNLPPLPVPSRDLPPHLSRYVRLVDAFVRSMAAESASAPSWLDGYRAQRAMDAIRRSWRSRKWMTLDDAGGPGG